MEWLKVLGQIIDPSSIYTNAYKFTTYITPIAGFLLIMASYVRVIETQMSSQSSLGVWGHTLRDIGLWTLVLTLYTALVGLLVYYVNDIYKYLNSLGSMDVILHQLDVINKLNEKKMAGETPDNYSVFSKAYWVMLGESAAAVPGVFVASGLYQVSLLAVTILAGFFRIVHAIFFSVAYAIGFIVIPLGIAKSLTITQGWKLLWFFVILWPIVEALIMGLFSLPIVHAANHYFGASTHAAGYDQVNVLLMFTVINGIAFLVMLAAFVLTGLLVMNSGPVMPMLMPVMNVSHRFFSKFKPRMKFKPGMKR